MPSPDTTTGSDDEPHRHHEAARSFGSDAERYDRARPRYPAALIERIVAAAPGRVVLDVGTGTGIVARQLQAAGCDVLGVDPDDRQAEFARSTGVEVDVSTFEAWDAAGRTFDAVVSAESWHWVDPEAGAAKAARILRPGGLLAVFWITGQPADDLADAFAAVYRTVLPAPFAARLEKSAMDAAQAQLRDRATAGIRATGAFGEPDQWRFEWDQRYTKDEWLDALRTTGGALPDALLGGLLDGVGTAIDAAGGTFTMRYVSFAIGAVRQAESGG